MSPGLENDEYVRKIAGYLPTAEVAFVDEIFKANSAILNALLTLLNERLFDNGNQRFPVPLMCLVCPVSFFFQPASPCSLQHPCANPSRSGTALHQLATDLSRSRSRLQPSSNSSSCTSGLQRVLVATICVWLHEARPKSSQAKGFDPTATPDPAHNP